MIEYLMSFFIVLRERRYLIWRRLRLIKYTCRNAVSKYNSVPVLMRVFTSREIISNLVRRGALTIAFMVVPRRKGKLTNTSIVDILTNDRLDKHCRKSSGLVTDSEWMAPEELP